MFSIILQPSVQIIHVLLDLPANTILLITFCRRLGCPYAIVYRKVFPRWQSGWCRVNC